MTDYKKGDYCEAHFPLAKKGIKRKITCTGTITEIEKNYLSFVDNDGYEYIIHKKDFEVLKIHDKCQDLLIK